MTCTQRTGAFSRSAQDRTRGPPRLTGSSSRTSATVGSTGVPSLTIRSIARSLLYDLSLGLREGREETESGHQEAAVKHITHWIDGKPWTGAEPGQRGE